MPTHDLRIVDTRPDFVSPRPADHDIFMCSCKSGLPTVWDLTWVSDRGVAFSAVCDACYFWRALYELKESTYEEVRESLATYFGYVYTPR